MDFSHVIGLVVTLALVAYLGYVLMRPERF
jgi:K+-transporting ATPase KdpF subunit